tara:strand:+ start:322 stop:549 length:228 start_codon:yes stop_codon:yes gene_type:complete
MKTRETIEKQKFQISEEDRASLLSVIEDIKTILDKKSVSEETLKKFTNILTIFDSLKENYMWRLLRAAKQNHMLS